MILWEAAVQLVILWESAVQLVVLWESAVQLVILWEAAVQVVIFNLVSFQLCRSKSLFSLLKHFLALMIINNFVYNNPF